MKIALYQPWIYLHGGLEKSLLELVTRSSHEWVVFTGHYEPENTFEEFGQVDVRVLNATTVKRTLGGTLYSALQIAKQQIPDENFDAVAVWCDGLGDLVTLRNNDLPLINICSTPLRAAFDPVYESLALENKGFLYGVAYKAFKNLFTSIDRVAWSHFDGVVATSTEVKNRIIKGQLCTDESKMIMAYPGINWQDDISAIQYEPLILLPGRIMWTKNIQLGIKAFIKAQLPKPWRLVVAGYVDVKSQTYVQELKALVPDGVAVEFVEKPSESVLENLYQKAAFCLFPPLNEDWGIVPLESMTNGKAVIANASGGPLESIVDQETGFLCPVDDVQAWAEAIKKLAGDAKLQREMGEQAHQHVKQFTWERFVSRIDNAIVDWVASEANQSGQPSNQDNQALQKKVLKAKG